MKKYFYPILSALIGAVIFGVGGFLGFMTYGGRNCDTPGKNCDCFCCNLFGLRGYESCADFGFWIGIGIGAIIGLIVYVLVKNKK